MHLDVMKVDYQIEDRTPVIYLTCRDENNERVRIKTNTDGEFRPRFYVPRGQGHEPCDVPGLNLNTFEREEIDVKYTELPRDVRKQRRVFEKTWQADVHFSTLWKIEKEIYCGIKVEDGEVKPAEEVGAEPRIWYADIEVDTSRGFPNREDAQSPIICISVYDNYTEEIFSFSGMNEHQLLNNFVEKLREHDPDYLTGWNFVDFSHINKGGFDWHYIYNRLENLNIDPRMLSNMGVAYEDGKCHGREIVDLMSLYKRFFQGKKFKSYGLDATVERDLNKDTENIGMDYDRLNMQENSWKDVGEDIVKYCENDVDLTRKIDEKWGIMKTYERVRRIVGDELSSTAVAGQFIDTLVLRKYKDLMKLPTRGMHDTEGYPGGMVLEPDKGIHENVAVFDFSKLYPTCMILKNISPETLKVEEPSHDEYNKVDDVYFETKEKGVVPEMYEELIDYRNKVKAKMEENYSEELDRKQYALKQITNSIYGFFGWAGSRLYIRELPEATTYAGRQAINELVENAESLGYESIYGDTDSVFISMDSENTSEEQLIERAKEIEPELEPEGYPLEFEKFYKRFAVTDKKKRYAGHIIWKDGKFTDEIDITGFEVVRSDAAKLSQELQEEFFRRLLKEKQSEKQLKEWIRDVIDNFEEYPLEKTGLPQPLSKEPEEYGNPANRKAVIYANRHLGTNYDGSEQETPLKFFVSEVRGDYPKTITLKRTVELSSGRKKVVQKTYKVDDVILIDGEIPDGFIVDWDKQIDRVVRRKLEKLFDMAGVDWGEITSGKKQMALGAF